MATAAPNDAVAATGSGKKKLIMMIVIALVVLVVIAGAALLLLKKKPPAEDGEEGDEPAAAHVEVAKAKPGAPPVYLPVDPFTVNLSDKEVDRYAQIAFSLEVVDQKTSDTLKAYMPAMRSGMLMVLSHKSAADLLSKEGKERLQREIQREALRPLGIEMEVEEEPPAEEEEEAPKKKKKKKKKAAPSYPVSNVLFSQFIVQ